MASSFTPSREVGFIGLGAMGAPMARNLVTSGYRLHVHDASPEATARFAESAECERPETLKALGAACEVVITMLPDGAAVRDVLVGKGGVADGLQSGGVLVDMSSSSPTGTRALSEELSERGFPLVDAPVSGGVPRAVDGTLSIMAGGDAELVARLVPLFAPMGKVTPVGGSGAGHAMKALNNYLSAANLVLAGEAVIAGTKFGLDPNVMIDVFNNSSGRNTATAQKFPAYVLPRTFDSGFALKLMAKDLRLALEVAHASGAHVEMLERCSDIYDRALAALGAEADNTDVVRYLESLAEEAGDDGLGDGG